jgi:hypothetical protein
MRYDRPMPFLIALVLALSPSSLRGECVEGDRATIPPGRSILIDGRLDTSEWDDACEIPVGREYRVLLKQDRSYLYVAVVRATPAVFGVNLYLASTQTAPAYLDLHASAKLGERTGRRGAWPEWEWWNHRAWSANVARFNAFTGQRFLPDTVKEFQIALDRLPAGRFLFTFDVETSGGVEQPVTTGVTLDGLHWIGLQQNR